MSDGMSRRLGDLIMGRALLQSDFRLDSAVEATGTAVCSLQQGQ
jgi:hypothetical protein